MRRSYATKLVFLGASILYLTGGALARPVSSSSNNTTSVNEPSNNQLYCEKTAWYDVCWFFFTNYLLHALSVRSLPGENVYSSTVYKLCCLLVPYTGVRRGLSLISRASSLKRDDLQAAARAGALGMVVRKPDWRPEDGQIVHGCHLRDVADKLCSERIGSGLDEGTRGGSDELSRPEKSACPISSGDDDHAKQHEISLSMKDPHEPPAPSSVLDRLSRALILTNRFNNDMPSSSPVDHDSIKIHGLCKLAPGYGLSYISPNVKIFARHEAQTEIQNVGSTRVASTHDIPRIMFSLIQTISGGYSLYKARGSQIDRYGYAAFGLTVLPYMIVSIINFVGSLLSAEYETIYMVHSTTMDEMVSRGGAVDGVVGSLHAIATTGQAPHPSQKPTIEVSVSICFEGTHDHLLGCEVGIEKGRSFTILPYEPPKPPPTEKSMVRLCRSFRQWHGLDTVYEPKPKSLPSGPRIEIPLHAPISHLPPPVYQDYLNILALIILSLTLALPHTVIAFLTGWKANQSTPNQRSFTLAWLINGQVQGYAVAKVEMLTGKKSSIRGLILIFIFYGANCLCGLTVVAQEMLEFGTCKAI